MSSLWTRSELTEHPSKGLPATGVAEPVAVAEVEVPEAVVVVCVVVVVGIEDVVADPGL